MGHARHGVLLVALFLAACTPRGALAPVPQIEAAAAYPIYYATTRTVNNDPRIGFGTERSPVPGFGRLTISVPPDRVDGDVAYPADAPDPQTDFGVIESARFDGTPSFRSAIGRELRALPRDQRDALIFVHGFNSTFAEGMYRLAQLDHDLSIPGVSVHYAWPSLNNPFGYSYDRDSVLFGRDGLEQLINEVRAAGAQDIILVGHSMGSLVVMETLRQMEIGKPDAARAAVQGVILMSPDLDVDLFRQQANRIGDLPQPFLIFTSQRDRALQLSARLTGQRERLGNLSDVERVADLDVTMLDVTNFEDGTRHLTAATSPSLIALLRDLGSVDAAFQGEVSGRPGLLPGTVLTVQNATQVILTPNTTILQ